MYPVQMLCMDRVPVQKMFRDETKVTLDWSGPVPGTRRVLTLGQMDAPA